MRKTHIPVIVPVRNESARIKATIDGIKLITSYADVDTTIIVVNDGSKDDTGDVARRLGCCVIEKEDRGYSALGLPELADTHNLGFDFVTRNIVEYEYIMVVGGDTTFSPDYLKILLEEMNRNPNLVMAAGMIDGIWTCENSVRGSGRIIRRTFWNKFGGRLPSNYYGWESYPVIYALASGYDVKTIYNALMYTSREPLAQVDWFRYGVGMKEEGSIFLYVLKRAMSETYSLQLKRSVRLLCGYAYGKCNLYPEHLRKFVRNYQYGKIKKFLRIAKDTR